MLNCTLNYYIREPLKNSLTAEFLRQTPFAALPNLAIHKVLLRLVALQLIFVIYEISLVFCFLENPYTELECNP